MHPICFYIGSRPIYWYGVMMATAFVAGIAHWRSLGRREGRDGAYCSDMALWIMVGAIVGARTAYVLENIDVYMAAPLSIIRIDQGGLVYYGGFAGAGLAIVLFARVKRERLLPFLDFVITGVPLGHALGRIGCFLNGCCYGLPTNVPWGVYLDGALRHPVQLYESAANLVLYVLLLAAYRTRKVEGRVLALYLLLYPVCRFILEYYRGDERAHLDGLSIAQASGIILFAIGVMLWIYTGKRHEASDSHP